MVVCDSCRKVITKDDNRVEASFKYIPSGWLKEVTRNDIVLCPDCCNSVMSFICNRVPREEGR